MTEIETKSLPENAYQPLKGGESYVPIVPAGANLPELTLRSVLWGVAFCVIFTVASAYSGLKVGQVMEAAIPISILAIGLARVYRRRSSLLENVIITGIGGAAGGVVAGAIFTLPALYILHLDPHPVQTIFICLAGGCLGGLVEPIFDGNIHVMFAQQGQPPNWYFYNVGYPWFEVPGNGLMGAPMYWLYVRFRRGISTRGLWGYFLGFYLFDVVWEIPGTAIGSYLYYGPQPFVLFGFPVWIGMMCGLGLPLAGYLAYVLSGALSGIRLWVMIAILTPVTIYGCEVIAWPMWITLNGAQSVSVTSLMAVLSLAFTLSAYYCMTQVYAKSRTARSPMHGAHNAHCVTRDAAVTGR